MTYLSNNLKYLRNQQNLSQATLANLLFVTIKRYPIMKPENPNRTLR